MNIFIPQHSTQLVNDKVPRKIDVQSWRTPPGYFLFTRALSECKYTELALHIRTWFNERTSHKFLIHFHSFDNLKFYHLKNLVESAIHCCPFGPEHLEVNVSESYEITDSISITIADQLHAPFTEWDSPGRRFPPINLFHGSPNKRYSLQSPDNISLQFTYQIPIHHDPWNYSECWRNCSWLFPHPHSTLWRWCR